MSDQSEDVELTERQERLITVGFLVVGTLFLLVAIYSAAGQLEAVQAAIAAAEDRPTSRVVLEELNREVLAAFIGAVLFASGALRLRE